MESKEINQWCRQLMYCDNYEDLRRPFEMDMHKVNVLVSEFNAMTDFEKSQVMAWVCGQLTDYRKTIYGRKKPPKGYLPTKIVRTVKCDICKQEVEVNSLGRHHFILHTER